MPKGYDNPGAVRTHVITSADMAELHLDVTERARVATS